MKNGRGNGVNRVKRRKQGKDIAWTNSWRKERYKGKEAAIKGKYGRGRERGGAKRV